MKLIALFNVIILCFSLICEPAFAAGEKNKDHLPLGTLAGYRGGRDWFDSDLQYDITDEEACWALLQKPITVLNTDEKEQIYPLKTPGGEKVLNEWQGGFINGAQAAVHVLGDDENGWTLIEGMDPYDRILTGYVRTKLLKTVKPNPQYGIIIDKLTQRLYVFVDGSLWSSCAVSTGLVNAEQPYNETASGEYLIGSWVGGFDSEGMYCEMGIRFDGGDLLHQVPYVTMKDGTKDFAKFGSLLGRKASHGCVRVARTANDEGLCIKWLWDHIKKNTKVVVWDDDGRTLTYPDDDMKLYYNPNGGSSYHASAKCKSVRAKYLPMKSFTYAELDTDKFAVLNTCNHCAPAKRKKEIDQINQERVDLGLLLGNPWYTGEKVQGSIAKKTDEEPSEYPFVMIEEFDSSIMDEKPLEDETLQEEKDQDITNRDDSGMETDSEEQGDEYSDDVVITIH